ncbi:uncharacterized protein LOC110117912 [Ceratitis capitata]|uniref:uncharacterized protein LOC110117912 n=1 Tax=Ceratitis capitata TaxID=7213 RepID=UPI000A10D43F|nr:uncharacterized protein LOC110117912 [Ceratitis capitata]
MLAARCLKHVSADQRIAYVTAIHFWLLFTQLMSGSVATLQNNISNASSSSPPQPSGFVSATPSSSPALMSATLMDKTLTNCSSANSSSWCPICATVNNVDYVLFGSAYLLEQTNRERQPLNAGHKGNAAGAVFREIAMGLCRSGCSAVICEDGGQPICARNVQSDEVRSFSGQCNMARDVCLNGNDWQLIQSDVCLKMNADPDQIPTTTTSQAQSTTTISTTADKLSREKLPAKRVKKFRGKSIPCPKVFNPVCAELLGVKATFINECLVNAENINFGKTWQIFSTGVCAEDYASSETHKNVIEKRSWPVGTATVTYNLNAPYLGMKEDVPWTANIENTNYMNNDVFSAYGGQMRSILQYSQPFGAMFCGESSLDTMPHSIRLFPAVDDRVSVCKFGAGSVCGSSAKYRAHKFENICELLLRNVILNEAWTVVNDGYCRNCILNCTTDYDPFCVSRQGLNYTIINQCHLDYALCRSNALKVLGRGDCANVLKNLTQKGYEQPGPIQNDAYLPRLARKTLDDILNEDEGSVLSESFSTMSLTESPAEIISAQTGTSPKVFTKETTEFNAPTTSTTTASTETQQTQTVRETHIMNLWRGSRTKSRFSSRKRNNSS